MVEVEAPTEVASQVLPDQENIDLRLFLGETYFNAGDLDRSCPHLDAALRLEPRRFDALVYRGAIAAERADEQEARRTFETAPPGSLMIWKK